MALINELEEHLLEHDQIHAVLAASVMDPLLGDLPAHFILSVERKQHLVDSFHQLIGHRSEKRGVKSEGREL